MNPSGSDVAFASSPVCTNPNYAKVILYSGNDDDNKKSSDEEEEMEMENDRVPSGKWHPILETRKREMGFRSVEDVYFISD